jgi:hypothetical protein
MGSLDNIMIKKKSLKWPNVPFLHVQNLTKEFQKSGASGFFLSLMYQKPFILQVGIPI